MTVRTYRSTNAGMPIQSGQIGAGLPIFDLLVNGSTPQTLTSITQAAGLATATAPGLHGLVSGQLVTMAGAAEADYNIEAVVTVTGLYSYTYPINPAAPASATGSLTWKIAGSGWTKPFTGTNLAAFKQPAGTRERYLTVNDTVATTCRIAGFETMTDAVTGTGKFPTEGQYAGGLYYQKSNAASAAARKYVLVCNGPNFFLYCNVDDAPAANTGSIMIAYGTLASFKAGDLFDNFIIGNPASTSTAFMENCAPSAMTTGHAGHYLCRSYTQLGTAVTAGKNTDSFKNANASTMGSSGMVYPSVVDGGIYMAPVNMHENTLSALRGEIPGLFAPMHNKPLQSFDTFDGSGIYAGRKYEAFMLQTASQVFLETSNTW